MTLQIFLTLVHFIALGFTVWATWQDAAWTEKGFAKFPQEGEGSEIICWLSRTNRPSFKQIFWFENLVHNAPVAALGLLLISHNRNVWAWSAFGLVGMVVILRGHFQGVNAWKKLIG